MNSINTDVKVLPICCRFLAIPNGVAFLPLCSQHIKLNSCTHRHQVKEMQKIYRYMQYNKNSTAGVISYRTAIMILSMADLMLLAVLIFFYAQHLT